MKHLAALLALLFILMPLQLRAQTPSAPSIIIRNAQVFDGIAATRSAPQDVLIRGERIVAMGSPLPAYNDSLEIDAQGRTLMPGMIDAHVHLMLQMPLAKALASDAFYWAYHATRAANIMLDSGFTTVRDMSGNVFALKQAIDEGLVAGPRIYPSGAMVSQTSGHADFRGAAHASRLTDSHSHSYFEQLGMVAVADGRSEVLLATRENLRRGASQIKIAVGGGVGSESDPLDVTQYTDDEIRAAVEAAADWGTYVSAHVYNNKGIRRAVDNGVQVIEHANMLDRATLKHLKARGAWLSPQVLVFESEIHGLNPVQQQRQRDAHESIDTMMRAVRELGFRNIVFGSDLITDLASLERVGEELVLRTRWFEPVEVLQQATSRAAQLLALSGPRNPYGELGVIKEGALADLLLVEGNPLEDIALLAQPQRNLRLIIKGGKIHKNTL